LQEEEEELYMGDGKLGDFSIPEKKKV